MAQAESMKLPKEIKLLKRSAIYLASLALGAAALTAPAVAQQASVTAGTAVKDTSGGTVGTVSKVDGDPILVKTDKHEVRLPLSSFTPTADGLLFGLTQAQLNAQVDQAMAAAQANFRVGAIVTGAGGATVGTVDALDAEWVTVKLASGAAVRLPRNALAASPTGLVTGLTAAEIQAAAGGAAAAAAEGDGATQ